MKMNKKTFNTILWGAFAVYLLVLLYILFLSRPPRLQYSVLEYFTMKMNLIPLSTILHYISICAYGYLTLAVKNLVGNFLLFLPMGALLPFLFGKINKFYKVVLIVASSVLLVEILQGLLRVGTPDVDDLILNLAGAMLGYAITKLPLISKTLKKISD